jgi:membrane protease YdiL (CAAX protease family)
MSDLHDVARYVFINDENELRSGWRVLLFFLCLFLVAALLSGLGNAVAILFPSIAFIFVAPAGADSSTPSQFISLVFFPLSNLVAAGIASAICARLLERRSLGSVGYKLHKGYLRDFVLGSPMGAATLAIAVGITASAGAVSFNVQTREWAPWLSGFLFGFLFFVIAASAEELIFRGFPFQALAHNQSGATAIVITALLFSLAHLTNPGASVLSSINTFLAGIWLGVACLLTRSLWLPTALHWSWNFAMVFIFGLPVSGLTELSRLSWLRGVVGEPAWLSGGGYGPEAGVAATFALLLSTTAIWKSGLFTASEDMLIAIRHGKPQPAIVSINPAGPEPAEPESALRVTDQDYD